MYCRVEVYCLSAIEPFFYLALECDNSNAVVLEHSQAGTDHFAGVVVSALGNLRLNEILEVGTKCY